MVRNSCFILLLLSVCAGSARSGSLADADPAQQIMAVSEKILHVFEDLGNFKCDVQVRYYRDAKEYKQYCFTWFQEQKCITRIRFSSPHRGLVAVYKSGDAEVTIQPFPFISFMKFKLSLYHSLLRTPSGQRMDQASIEYLSRFFYNNIQVIQQNQRSFFNEADRVAFAFWAKDYTGREALNKYHVTVSKDNYFPMKIERYDRSGELIEVIIFKAFVVHDDQGDTAGR